MTDDHAAKAGLIVSELVVLAEKVARKQCDYETYRAKFTDAVALVADGLASRDTKRTSRKPKETTT